METGLKSIPCWNNFPHLIFFVVNKEYFFMATSNQITYISGFGIQTWDNLDHRGNYASTVISLVFAKSSSLPLFASNLVFQGGNPQSLSLLCCFLVCPWQVKSTPSRTLFLRIFILGEIVWPSSLALFMIVFIRIFVQGNCSTQLSGGSLAQLVIVRGLAGLDSTCARFSTIHIFCSGCKRTGPLKTNFQFFLLLLQLH